jgi:hypothetical protein
MKQCSLCKEYKPIEEYSMKRGKPTNRCKPCNNEYFKKWYLANKDKQIQRVKSNEVKNKLVTQQFILEYFKKNPCVDCGETNPIVLEFDHVSGTKKKNVSELIYGGYTLDRLKQEIELCEVRCANCHRIRTAYQFDWWITKFV